MLKVGFTIITLLSLMSSNAQVVWGTNNSRTETRDNAGLQGNAGALSGFFESNSPVNYPTGASGWWHLLDVRHGNLTDNYAMQFAGSFFDQQLWFRKTNNSATQAWSRVLTESNGVTAFGTGSGVPGSIKLQDESNIYANYLFASLASANNRSGMMFQSNGSINQALVGSLSSGFAFRWLAAPSGVANYYDDSNEKMRLTMDGNLGIGTTAPVNKLHVNGKATIGEGASDNTSYGTLQLVRTADQGDNRHYLTFVRAGSSVTGMGYARNSNVFGIWKYGDNATMLPVIALTDAQSVGIGTTDPGPYKLAVEGWLGARKIKVTAANPWSDYVFDNDYRLWTLAEVEKYISDHKHLPDIPSAAEVAKDGIDVGENQALLLKKIEELTLYMIDQNKRTEAQERQIDEQNKKITEQNKMIGELLNEMKELKSRIK